MAVVVELPKKQEEQDEFLLDVAGTTPLVDIVSKVLNLPKGEMA